jgi:hypothetical protein
MATSNSVAVSYETEVSTRATFLSRFMFVTYKELSTVGSENAVRFF